MYKHGETISRGRNNTNNPTNNTNNHNDNNLNNYSLEKKNNQNKNTNNYPNNSNNEVFSSPEYTLILPDINIQPTDFREFLKRDLLETSTLLSLELAG